VAWLRQLVAGHAAKAWRTHAADKRAVHQEAALAETLSLDAPASPVLQAIAAEQNARLATAIQALPDAMREVVVRRVFHQEPFEVVAAALNRSPGATRVLWTRALRELRDRMRSSDPSSSSP
jgi:RNA polymerase sigma factor (sigma-70 family)